MTIAPVHRTIELKVTPARAFELFTAQFGKWWPKGRTPGPKPHADVILEPAVGGRWLEVDADGAETPWGEVLVWDPPRRLVLAWQLDSQFQYDANLVTELEITFTPINGGAVVTLEHRNLERFGADADKIAGRLRGGWPGFLGEYAAFVATQSR